jgi:geranylgeranyl pyrophosphate synthase
MRNSNLDASLRGHDNFSFQAYQQRIHDALLAQLPPVHEPPELLHKAMHYAVFNGGKRLRPLLVYAIGDAFNVNLDKLDLPACAVEFIHSYSLIHDDLPAMDNDDWRRGKPSCHKAFDEATAILAGDALQTLAFETLSCLPKNLFSDRQKLLMIHTLSPCQWLTGHGRRTSIGYNDN